jgi:hypothetical protein
MHDDRIPFDINSYSQWLDEQANALAILAEPLAEISADLVGIGLLKRGCRRWSQTWGCSGAPHDDPTARVWAAALDAAAA